MTPARPGSEAPYQPGHPASITAKRETEDLPLHLSRAWRQAERRADPFALRRLAEEAGGRKDRHAVAALCLLIERPHTLTNPWARRRHRKRPWVWTRVAAVNALAQIGDAEAVDALTGALFDPDPAVREAAAFVLPGFGDRTLRSLVRALRTRSDWPLQSMKLLIGVLGALNSRRATPALLHVLAERAPSDPARWARQAFVRPFGILSAITLCWWLTRLFADPPVGGIGWLHALLALLVGSFVPFLFCYIVLICTVFVPLLNREAVREREELAVEALQAIATLKDVRAISTVVESVVGTSGRVSQTALTALQTLLPLMTTEEEPHIPAPARRQLLAALRVASQRKRPETELEIVRALEHLGDGEAVEAVERIVQRGSTPELRREAARVLPALRARQRRKHASSSLLRASGPPLAAAVELLLPADNVPATAPDELLRPPESA